MTLSTEAKKRSNQPLSKWYQDSPIYYPLLAQVEFKFYLDAAPMMQCKMRYTITKITPIKDYLLTIVEPTKRQELAELLQVPGSLLTQLQSSIKN